MRPSPRSTKKQAVAHSPKKNGKRQAGAKLNQKSNSGKPSGRPRICQRCPGKPLLASVECRHSKIFNEKLKDVRDAGITAPDNIFPLELAGLWNNLQTARRQYAGGNPPMQAPIAAENSVSSYAGPPAIPPVAARNFLSIPGAGAPNEFSSLPPPSDGTFYGLPPPGITLNPYNSTSHNPVGLSPVQDEGSRLNDIQNSGSTPAGFAPSTPRLGQGNIEYGLRLTSNSYPRSSPLPPSSPQLSDNDNHTFMAAPTSPVIDPAAGSDELDHRDETSSVPPIFSPGRPVDAAETSCSSIGNIRIRVKPSQGIIPFGVVMGAAKGPNDWEPARLKALPDPLEKASDASRRYRTLIKDIVCRCERLGVETGCWLYLAAQHPMSREPFINFTSPRLINDFIPILDELHQTAHKMFVSLQSTRRFDAAELAVNLKEAQDTIKASQAENDSLRADKERLDMELQHKDELIRRLQQAQGLSPS